MSKNLLLVISVAILHGSAVCAEATVNTETNPQVTPDAELLKAIGGIDPDAVKAALDAGANPNWNSGLQLRGPTSDIPPNKSVTELAVERICIPGLFRRGTYDNWRDKEQEKELEELCTRILQSLFEAGAKFQESDDDILYYPIWCGCSSVVQLLLDKGTNPNARMLHDITPVELAEQYGHSDIVDMLLKNGARAITLREAAQLRLVYCANEHTIIGMERAFKDGAVVDGTNKAGETALMAAVHRAQYSLEAYAAVLYLLQKGADVNRQGIGVLKQTALHVVAGMPSTPYLYGRLSSSDDYTKHSIEAHQIYLKLIVEALLKAGAFVSVRDSFDRTPLHNAAECNNHETAEMLIQAGAKIMPKDTKGKTALDYAESAEMIKLLKSHGAQEQ